MSPVYLGDDGATITIQDEVYEIPPQAAEWFAAQPDPEEAFKLALRVGAETMKRGGYLEYDAESQYHASGIPHRPMAIATEETLTPEMEQAMKVKQMPWK